MKHLTRPAFFKHAFLLFVFAVVNAIAWAQDSTGSVSSSTNTSTTTTETWYTAPWVWVVGGAVLILLIVALTRGGGGSSSSGRTDKVTVTKTTNSETE
jgi:beta-lactamase regulating signal transducer with metallopeptidase domain